MANVGNASMFSGCYDASRAAALSGVPKSTVYWWARQGIVAPSISPVQEKLWSYGDLIALRIVSWLRHAKNHPSGAPMTRSPMPEVRSALELLDQRGLTLWDLDAQESPLLVDTAGQIFVQIGHEVTDLHGAKAIPQLETFGLTGPFALEAGSSAPDLIKPRERLRIMPGKLSGEPHIEKTRVTSLALAALAIDGFTAARIGEMYELSLESIEDALDLERQLGTLDQPAA